MKNILLILSIAILFSCKKEPVDEPEPEVISGVENKVLICNEGNFNWGNATFSLYDKENETVQDSVFQKANDFGLGDVLQSATYSRDYIYLVVNNSAKIEVINKSDFKVNSTIDGFNSPRYFIPVSNSKGYVSDWQSNELWIVDLDNNSISGSIKCNGWTEEMLLLDDVLYVTNPESEYLYLVDVILDEYIDSIQVGPGVSSIQKDTNNVIWCLSTGDEANSIAPSLIKILSNNTFENFDLDVNAVPSKLKYNVINHKLYFINGDVCEFDIFSELMNPTFIPSVNKVFYGLGVDSEDGNIYVSDAKDFVQGSTAYIYSNSGALINSFETGINSGYFLFD